MCKRSIYEDAAMFTSFASSSNAVVSVANSGNSVSSNNINSNVVSTSDSNGANNSDVRIDIDDVPRRRHVSSVHSDVDASSDSSALDSALSDDDDNNNDDERR
jgi:hypothetical protein